MTDVLQSRGTGQTDRRRHSRSQAPAWRIEEEAGASKTLIPKLELGNESIRAEKSEFTQSRSHVIPPWSASALAEVSSSLVFVAEQQQLGPHGNGNDEHAHRTGIPPTSKAKGLERTRRKDTGDLAATGIDYEFNVLPQGLEKLVPQYINFFCNHS